MASSDARAVALIIEFNFVCLTLAIMLCSLAWWGLVLRIWHPRNLSLREMLEILVLRLVRRLLYGAVGGLVHPYPCMCRVVPLI